MFSLLYSSIIIFEVLLKNQNPFNSFIKKKEGNNGLIVLQSYF